MKGLTKLQIFIVLILVFLISLFLAFRLWVMSVGRNFIPDNTTKTIEVPVPAVETETKYICKEEITSVARFGSNNQLNYNVKNTISGLKCISFGIQTHCSFDIVGDAFVTYGIGKSMLPCHYGVESSKLIILKTKEVELGDFIMFWSDEQTTVLHQVVGFNRTIDDKLICYITQGINNQYTDQDDINFEPYKCIKPEDIIGREIVIFRDGVAD